jgi:hypothetical protein
VEGKPIPRWTDDPLLTKNGLSGGSFVGGDRPRKIHIEELQIDRMALEAEFQIEPPTEFSALEEHGFHVRKTHITELRESTEKILDAVGSTLEDYFKLDSEGNEIEPGPNDTVKTDWTNVQRGLKYLDKNGTAKTEFMLSIDGLKPCPTFPENTRIRAIHIEDLRHFIPTNLYPVIFCSSFHDSWVMSFKALGKRGKDPNWYFRETIVLQ